MIDRRGGGLRASNTVKCVSKTHTAVGVNSLVA